MTIYNIINKNQSKDFKGFRPTKSKNLKDLSVSQPDSTILTSSNKITPPCAANAINDGVTPNNIFNNNMITKEKPTVQVSTEKKSNKATGVRYEVDAEWFNLAKRVNKLLNRPLFDPVTIEDFEKTVPLLELTEEYKEWLISKLKFGKNCYICVTYRKYGDEEKFLEHPDWLKATAKRFLPSWETKTLLAHLENLVEVEHETLYNNPDYYKSIKSKGYYYIVNRYKRYYNLTLDIFHSWGDIRAFLGEDLALILQKFYTQKRIVELSKNPVTRKNALGSDDSYSKFCLLPFWVQTADGIIRQLRVQINDHAGHQIGGLAKVAPIYQIPMLGKSLMDDYKEQMDIAYEDNNLRESFITYALGDNVLHKIDEAVNKEYKEMCDLYGINLPEKYRVPPTKGAFMASIILKKLSQDLPITDEVLGVMDIPKIDAGTGKKAITPLAALLSQNGILNKAFSGSSDYTTSHLALTMGGRCKNEDPITPVVHDLTIAMDFVQCYGDATRSFYLPIGLGLWIDCVKDRKEDYLSLEQVLKDWGDELVDNCYYFIADIEQLSFEQVLLFSKILKDDKIELNENAKDDAEENQDGWGEDEYIKGDFGLLTKEAKNTILTSHSIKQIMECSSDVEWGELKKKIKIKAGEIFPKSEMIVYENEKSFVEWESRLLANKGKRKSKINKKTKVKYHIDDRKRVWIAYPMEIIMGEILDARKQAKNKRNTYRRNTEDWQKWDAIQTSLKLNGNAPFGDFCSPWFPISNPCMANNITDMARMGSACQALISSGKVTATDGSEGILNQFRDWVGNFPSLNTQSLLNRPYKLDNRNLSRVINVPLGTVQKDDGGNWFCPIGKRKWVALTETREVEIDGDSITEYCLLFDYERDIDKQTYSYLEPEKVWYSQDDLGILNKFYEYHIKWFFRNKNLPWLKTYRYAGKTIGLGIATHSQANYYEPKADGIPNIAARGHSAKGNYELSTGKKLDKPSIEILLETIYNKEPIPPFKPTFKEVPLKINAANKPNEWESENGLVAGDTTRKNTWVRPISASLFYYPTLASRIGWMKLAERLKTRTGWGLEYFYLDDNQILPSYEKALKDIQKQIDDGVIWDDRKIKQFVEKEILREHPFKP